MAGFLAPREREYLKRRRVWPGHRMRLEDWERPPADADIKWRIHDKVADWKYRDIVRQFRLDLEAVHEYYKTERPEDWHTYTTAMVGETKEELEQLRTLVDNLIKHADSDRLTGERDQLRGALRELAAGLDYIQARLSNPAEASRELGLEFDGVDVVGPPEYVEENAELIDRQRALAAVLFDEGLFEIFEWVAEHQGDVQTKSKIGERERSGKDERWPKAIGQWLIGKYGLVREEPDKWGYFLTRRGEVVHRAIVALQEVDAVADRVDEPSDVRGVVRDLLSFHFSADGWGSPTPDGETE